MQISISFNWPIDQKSARVKFGAFNVEDKKYLLKVGVIAKTDPEHVRWLKAEFLDNEMLGELEFDVERGDKVVVQKFSKDNTTNAIGSFTWDINEKWPPKATGATSVDIPWTF
jgi:hypothetical protein